MKRKHILLLGALALSALPAAAQVTTTEKKPAVGFHYSVTPGVSGQYRLKAGTGGTYAITADKDVLYLPGQQYYQGDPADSLFRAANGLFQRQEYRQAADRFADLRNKHASSRYWCDAAYYEAFARYRLGTPNDLRAANRVLTGMESRCTTASRRSDVPALTARVDAALARLGDNDAAERVKRAASQGVCDSEEYSVKIAALSALAGLDGEAALPVLRTVLAQKDECSAPVRRQAVSMVARSQGADAVGILSNVARTDPDRETQYAAVRALANIHTDAAYAAIEEFLRNSTDERLQSTAASALASNENPRAQAAVRALIERKDVAERIRVSAIQSLGSRSAYTLDYWKSLYGRVESDDLRRAVIYASGHNLTDEAQAWLLTLARDQSQPSAVREAALSRVRTTAPINELGRLIETADSRRMRVSIVNALSARKEPEATDRLIEIAKSSTDPEVRNAAIRGLSSSSRRSDPKVIKALQDILAGRQM